jgi:hypothetical protein
MSRPLPHRIEQGRLAGACRDCGTHDAYSAPDTCCRCALERMGERDYEIVVNPIAQFVHVADEMWRLVAAGLQSGAIKSDRFYVYVGHNDGGSLGLPMGDHDLSPDNWCTPSARAAQQTALALTGRYSQVWVVTTVGCWNAVSPLSPA